MKFYNPAYVDAPAFRVQLEQIIRQVRPYTMVPDSGLELLIRAVQHLLAQQIPGDLVECGVWQGGCAAAMKLTAQAITSPAQMKTTESEGNLGACTLHLFDSFEGLPPVQPIDGPMAKAWQQDINGPIYFDNCTASLESVQQNFQQLGLWGDSGLVPIQFHQGWFAQTVPDFVAQQTAPIALLRLDGDWYESTKVCLENLYPLVSENGVIIIDDYYAWDGCAVAVHEYFGKQRLNHRIRALPDFSAAYVIKHSYKQE
jgi:O-methyltransferase